MQSEAEAVRAAEGCVLADAERHFNGDETPGGKCCRCRSFHEAQASEELPRALRHMLDFCGVCDSSGDMLIVDRGEWHSADECWEEDR